MPRKAAMPVPPDFFKRPLKGRKRGATLAQIGRAEQALGVKFPKALKTALRMQDGGELYRPRFQLPAKPPKSYLWSPSTEMYLGAIHGVTKHTYLGISIVDLTEIARRYDEFPRMLIPLYVDNYTWCCLDYRRCGPRGEPRIVQYSPDVALDFPAADSFEALVAGMYRSDEDMSPAVIALDAGAPRGNELGQVLQELGCRPNRKLARAKSKYRHPPTWRWRKYRNLVPGLPVWIQAETNRLYPISVATTRARPDKHPMLTVSVSPKQAEACLQELLTALGPRATLIRTVE